MTMLVEFTVWRFEPTLEFFIAYLCHTCGIVSVQDDVAWVASVYLLVVTRPW